MAKLKYKWNSWGKDTAWRENGHVDISFQSNSRLEYLLWFNLLTDVKSKKHKSLVAQSATQWMKHFTSFFM